MKISKRAKREARQLFRRVAAESFARLDDYGTPELGTVTGANDYFALSEVTRRKWNLDERLFKLGIGRALQGDVERLDDDRLVIVQLIVSDKDFGIATATEQARHEVAIIDNAVFEFQFRHGF